MWAEGPGPDSEHGHYNNMADDVYTRVGCGLFVNGDEVTVTQDFD